MDKPVELLKLCQTAVVQVTSVKRLSPSKRGPDDLPYRVTFDTPVDGNSGVGTIDISEDRARDLGLIEADPDADAAAAAKDD